MVDVEENIHNIKLADLDFEGPLDLLVYLVQKNEVDVYDIPIARITEQFLAYVESMTAERLTDAGEFLLMAATLLRIKARMLLPRPDLEEEAIEDPRRELVLRIIEYQQFREVAEHLRDQEEARRLVFPRGTSEESGSGEEEPAPESGRRATLGDLLQAFAVLLRQAERDRVHRLEPLAVSIEDKSLFVRETLRSTGRTTFAELFVEGEPRGAWIVTFVALLEMAREGEIRLRQGEAFGEIYVYAAEGAPDD